MLIYTQYKICKIRVEKFIQKSYIDLLLSYERDIQREGFPNE